MEIRANINNEDVVIVYNLQMQSQTNQVIMTPLPNQEDELEKLSYAANAQFNFDCDVVWIGNEGDNSINFGNDHIIDIIGTTDHDINIQKSAQYDKEKGIINYKINMTSYGNNMNIKVDDVFTGTAVIFNKDVQLNSSIGTDLSNILPTYNDTGFSLTIPEMKDQEVIEIQYSAKVNYENIKDGYIDIDDTQNSVKVTSDENEEKNSSAGINHESAYTYAKKGTEFKGEDLKPTDDNQYYIIEWTIDVNPDFKNIGDIEVKDILLNTDIQKYDQNSFVITRYTSDNQSYQVNQDVQFDDQDTSWNIVLPSVYEGNPVKYTIQYKTLIDKTVIDNLYIDTVVQNKLDTNGDKDDGTISVTLPAQKEFTVSKKYENAQLENHTVDWVIETTIPKEGYQTLTVTDNLPQIWKDNVHYIPAVKETDIIVLLEDKTLLQNQDYRIQWNGDKSQFILIFDQGISAGENERVLTIRYTTDYGNWPDGQMQINTAIVKANGKENSASAEFTPINKSIEKNIQNSQTLSPSNQYVYYQVGISGITDNDLDENGYVTVTDTFNGDILKYDPNIWDTNSLNVYYTNNPGFWGGQSSGEHRYQVTDHGDGTISFKFKPFQDQGKYYARYYFSYRLSIKDDAALNQLIEEAAKQGTTQLISDLLKNTASFAGMESSCTVPFQSNQLNKTLITGASSQNQYTATWKIIVNEKALRLNNGHSMTITDTFTAEDDHNNLGMNYVYGSMKVKYNGIEQNIEDIDYSITDNGNLEWVIPDETKVEIEYQTRLSTTVELEDGQSYSYSNHASLSGNIGDSTSSGSIVFDISGTGSASSVSFEIVKQDVEDLTKGLKGAVFEIYAMNQDGKLVPIQTVDGDPVIPTYTTDDNGIATVVSNQEQNGWSLWTHRVYYIVEKVAPEGYDLTYPYDKENLQPIAKIWINEFGNYEISGSGEVEKPDDALEVNTGGQVFIVNGQVVVPVKKVVNGGTWGNTDQYIIKIETDNPNAPLPKDTEIVLTQDRQEDQFILSGFTQPNQTYEYIITEQKGNKDNVKYSEALYRLTVKTQIVNEKLSVETSLFKIKDDNGTGVDYRVDDATFINSIINNGTGSLTISKTVEGIVTNQSFDFEIQLSSPLTGKYGDLEFNNGKAYASLKDGEIITISGLPAGIQYNVIELDANSGNYLTSSENAEGIITADVTKACQFKNTYYKINIPISKQWLDDNDNDGKRPESITVRLLRDGKETGQTLVLNEGNQWQGQFTDLAKYEDGKKIDYTIAEAKVEGYTSQITGSMEEGFVIANSHEKEQVSISGTKTWNDNDNSDGKRPESITVNLYANGRLIESREVSAKDGWKWTFRDLDRYQDGQDITYTITENAVEGYQSIIDGYDIENIYTPEHISITVMKQWLDDNDNDGKRPESITVRLLRDGKETGQTLVLNEGNQWQGQFTDLAKYEDGKKIDYTIAEAKVEGYTSQITGSMEEGFVITNVKENIIVNKSDSFNNNITGEINIDKKDSFDSIKTDDESYLTISTFLFMTSLLGIIILGAYEFYLKKVNK